MSYSVSDRICPDYCVSITPEPEKKRLLVFSNVKYPAGQKIQTRKTDILVFLNAGTSAAYYAADPVEAKICWHRTTHPDFGPVLLFCENHYVTSPQEIPQSFIDDLGKKYDWNYQPRSRRKRCMTTGYIVVCWLEKTFPDREIVLVNFGMDVQGSTRRSSDHNWQFEDRQMQRFHHIFTADAKTFRKRKIYIAPRPWLGDNVLASAVIKNIIATGMFEINVDPRGKQALWQNCPYLNREITRANCDNVFRMRDRDRWRADCRHLIDGCTAEFAGYIGEDVPVVCRKPEIWMQLPEDRLVESPYIVINTGWQNSAETKRWSQTYWQQLVDLFPDRCFVQVGETRNHAVPLRNTCSLIDRTDLPRLAQVVRDAACVISPPSAVIHFAEAYDTPSITLAGGREPAGLTAYPGRDVLSVIGQLSCCRRGGCHNSHFAADRICNRPVRIDGDTLPTCQCMTMITPEMVAGKLKQILSKGK